MKWMSLATLFAATVAAAPSPSVLQTRTWSDPETGIQLHNVGDQGDGFYLVTFDDTNVGTVEFTPASEFNYTLTDEELAAPAIAARDDALVKRNPTCSGHSGKRTDMDKANVQLAKNARDHGIYNKNAWGWVFEKGEASFFCNYEKQILTYEVVIAFHTKVSNYCGSQSSYGYDHCHNNCGVKDASIGRTNKGDHFCTKTFTGGA